jgi:phage terminase large subunit GpA-like protein
MLWEKRENFSEVVPAEAGLLTAAVDVQADRLEVLVKAWGKNEESWDLEHLVIAGDPGIITDMRLAPGQMQFDAMAEPGGVWGKLYAFLQKEFDHESGGKLHISAIAVDTGFKTDEALEFCWQCRQPKAFAVKGASIKEAPIVKRPSKSQAKGKKRKYNTPIFVVGVSTAKEVVTNRLSRARGTGLIHVPERLGFEYFRQLTAEKKVRFKRAGRMVEEWRQTGRNEALDLEVYNLALLRILYPSMVILNTYLDGVLSNIQGSRSSEQPAPRVVRRVRSRGIND